MRWVILYSLMLVAWLGVGDAYGRAFRFTNGLIFDRIGADGAVQFRINADASDHMDSQALLRQLRTGASGHFPLSSRYLGYVPTVLLISLVLATPIPWRRRWRALLLGMALMHVFIALRIWLILLAQFAGTHPLATFSLGHAGDAAIEFVAELVSVSLAGSYVMPIVIWILATFRKGDWVTLCHSEGARDA